MKVLASAMEEAGMNAVQLARAAGLDPKLVKTIAAGNYTPSPAQRQSLAAALGLTVDEIAWGHAVPVEYLRGNGPQTGRQT